MPKITRKKAAEKVSDESPKAVLENKPIGTVYVEKSVTKNMGNYNSAKISVGVTLNINPTDEDLAEAKKTINVCSELLDKEIEKQVSELMT